jgi:ribulose-phosphate 3-epimerase
MNGVTLSASMMCADFTRLLRDVAWLEDGGVEWLHFDIMDGHFVPNFALGPDLMRRLRDVTDMTFDVHLMIEHPEKYVEQFVSAGGDLICVHVEACSCITRCISLVKNMGAKVAVAIKPETPVQCLGPILAELDMVLVMTVNPGFAGQRFLPETLAKIAQVAAMRDGAGLDFRIEVDGNVSLVNIPKMVAQGADVLVCGTSSLFTPDMRLPDAIARLNALTATLQNVEE